MTYDDICRVCGTYCPDGGGAHAGCKDAIEAAQAKAYAEGRRAERGNAVVPELLELLQEARDELKVEPEMWEFVARIDAAIAKATSKAP